MAFGRGKHFGGGMPKFADHILGGWELSGTFTMQSGRCVVFTSCGRDKSWFSGRDLGLPHDQQSLGRWFDTSQFYAFPNKNTDISIYPAWTGIQNLPGYSYKPAAGDTIKNGVYQDFGTYVRAYPTRCGSVRASLVNNVDAGLYKNIRFHDRAKLQLRFERYHAINHGT